MAEEKKIILIEDDNFLQDLAAKKLRSIGFNVEVASTGEEGMKKIEEGDFNLIILDIILPEMGGFEVLEKVKNHENPEISNKPVIMFSNLGQQEEVEKAKELGADDYLIKAHFTPNDIADKIQEYL